MDVKKDFLPDFPGEAYKDDSGKTSFIVTSVDAIANWGRSNSLWPLSFGTSCCAIEMMSTVSAKYDWSRFGFEVMRASPRQCDLIIVCGTITYKMAPVLKRLYNQMPEPRYVIAMGACAISGGPFCKHSYSVVNGIDKFLPVDVYIPGCPPRPEALIHGMMSLQKKVMHSKAYVIEKPKKDETAE
ncbi:NADH-quinone oxidoreductase subunit B [Parabacteroides sp. FAFU027]|uniref:NADH-quinone oxidoreductase subunit B n=1 Tax=Parabacteroides sp. FAFU027 TaxID=2922715 RepID=UPI00397A8613